MSDQITRRKALGNVLKGSLLAMGGLTFSPINAISTNNNRPPLPVRISMNCSTLLHYKLPADKQIDLVADAGFDGIEMWMSDIKTFLQNGGTTQQLKNKLESRGLVLENIIGFSKWCSDSEDERKSAMTQLKEEMLITKEMGGAFIAAPVQGIEKIDPAKFNTYAERYRAILDLGDETGVTPVMELWGMGALHKISDCAQIAIATGHSKATMLLDFYHVYRGGNDWDTVDLINAGKLPVIHMNDYPATPAFDQLTDADRVLPGEGVCPFDEVIPKLLKAGFRGGFSVELFNKEYWNTMDAPTLMKVCYEKTYAVVQGALNQMD
ncbi:sugar phosphate isomerase/epimerase [Euzebyella marina]|uniref:Sugar phosphate isomerase/epimerase n=1 Tax=Euzebyella marina TaxID=1761453 RepID=A0A3G2L3N6_9FLAO|nr:sugar phosphate isomerase/epimerase [Euzebyella marina]AYN66887.1 sugar phosphate isomerase/epimerase [Euzebyella marina]